MNVFLIKNYIRKLTINDIKNFALKHDVFLADDKSELILNTIKKDWQTIIYGDSSGVFKKLKFSLSDEEFEKIYCLYKEFKQKYSDYL